VRSAATGDRIEGGVVFVAPPGRHLVVGSDGTLCTDRWGKVRHVCPSADLLFESVAESHGGRAIAVVLTGMGSDGARGVECIRRAGGFVIAQDAVTAAHDGMPRSAVETRHVDLVLRLDQIAFALATLAGVDPS
jgi:two-component system chemotaxis response regulator CheB